MKASTSSVKLEETNACDFNFTFSQKCGSIISEAEV